MWSEIDGHSPYADLKLDLERMKRWHPLNQSLYFGYKTILPGLLLNQKGDCPAMANSVEARYPFLDEKVVDYCCRLAPKWKLRGLLRDKRVLREFASDMLPKSITRRRKHIFRAPFASTFFAKPPQFVQQLVSPESLATTGYFDSGEVERQFRDYLDTKNSGRRDLVNEMALSTVMATQLWHHIYLGGGLCELPAWTPPEIGGRVSPREPAAAGPQLV